ncbi:hypothetical protein [Azotobacter beijerinckii]|uniref:hypothetical protein n=1 Tax=Azotobacter beijerinckii TaxID=170623 RepID=UPI0029547FAC|nr:hypothetical protein [Azotobacter beijerinckii]MDV7209953.1 hypothetical protein [Azotobacter beijerinckii]
MHDKINTLASKERERQSIAALMAQHEAAGRGIVIAPTYTPKPMPPRRDRIDPETVLKRKPAQSKVTSSVAAKQDSDAAIAEIASRLAANGESLNSAAALMKCGRMRLSRIAEDHGIEFTGTGSRPNRAEHHARPVQGD